MAALMSNHSSAASNTILLDKSYYGKKKVEVGASEIDAEIYANGKIIGKGSVEITVGNDDCVIVEAKK